MKFPFRGPQELLLLLRAVITMGVGLTPVAHLLPIQVLLNLRLGKQGSCGYSNGYMANIWMIYFYNLWIMYSIPL